MTLKCINCGKEYVEQVNGTFCTKCGEDPNLTYVYSTIIPSMKDFISTPLEYDSELNVYLKREDQNPIGTFKYRKAYFIKDRKWPGKFALATSGNQAMAIARFIDSKNVYLYVSQDINFEKLRKLQYYYDNIEVVNRILNVHELCKNDVQMVWNITNGMDPIGASAFYRLGMELELDFDNIIVPCGSGELASTLQVYFDKLRGKKTVVHPVFCNAPEAESIYGNFVPMLPFLNHYGRGTFIYKEEYNTVRCYAEKYKCEFSSAVVFEAYRKLRPKLEGKTCLIITGAKQ